MKKLLIFDLDGTLIDSANDIAISINSVITSMGLAPVSLETVKAHIGEGPRRLLYDLFPEATPGSEKHHQIEQAFSTAYAENLTKTTAFFDMALDFLNSWQGHKAIVTNKTFRYTERILKNLDRPVEYWDMVLGGDSLPTKKPDPTPLFTVLNKVGLSPSQAVMIGDGHPDMLAANNAKMDSIAVSFGYTPLTELQKHRPTAILHSYKDLASLIASLK